ncbi:Cuticle protein 6 [Chionoecetes opilio]|uniref:Cuticle protein 6 n=1 Tax=Chionoecetes opilio TaxID=41210 RepID=A0A8J4XLG4_CHIOP|nr:Cuticle protein 6 [Chionoecetes opilio]
MAPEDRGSYFVNTKSGRYNYGYNTGDGIAKVEVRQPDGSVVGSYRYFDPNGKQVVRSYVADSKGFRVLGNDLPVSPDTPVSHLSGLPAFTGAVEGTAAFDIPPPLGSPALSSQHHQYQHQHRLKEQQLVQQQNAEYRKQQEKLEALKRELEALQQKVYGGSYTSHNYQGLTRHPTQHLAIRNHLTHGYTSPYRYFDRDLNYDFPAGFAYAGLPTITDTSRRTRYAGDSYIIGRTR